MTDKPRRSATNHRELGRLEKWVDVNFMKFSKGRCQVLYLERKNPVHQCRLRAGRLARKDLGGPGGHPVEPAVMESYEKEGYQPPGLC